MLDQQEAQSPKEGSPQRRSSAPFAISTTKVLVTDEALCREHGMDKDGTCLCHPHVMIYYPTTVATTATAAANANAGVKSSSDDEEGGEKYTIVPCQYCLAAQDANHAKSKQKHTGRQQKHKKKNMLVYDVGQVKDLDIPVVSLDNQQSDEEDEFMLLSSSPAKGSGSNKPSAFHASFNSSISNMKKWHNSMKSLDEECDDDQQ